MGLYTSLTLELMMTFSYCHMDTKAFDAPCTLLQQALITHA